MKKPKNSPTDKVRQIDELYPKVPPGIEFEPKPKRRYYHLIAIFIVFLIGTGFAEYRFRLSEYALKIIKKSGRDTALIKEERTEEKRKRGICILKVPLSQDIINVAVEKGIKRAILEIEDRKKINQIRLFVGDFTSLKDAVVVSDRLNEKGIPHRIENVGDKWRIYIEKDIEKISSLLLKGIITPDDIRYAEATASSMFREIVHAEVETSETTAINIVFQFDSEEECSSFFKFLQPRFPVKKEFPVKRE